MWLVAWCAIPLVVARGATCLAYFVLVAQETHAFCTVLLDMAIECMHVRWRHRSASQLAGGDGDYSSVS